MVDLSEVCGASLSRLLSNAVSAYIYDSCISM
jgi:hypothetical protein